MKAFVDKYEDRIHGVLSCFDRMLFRGNLPIMSGWSMAQLLQAHEIDCASVKPFLLSNAERVKAHAIALARERGRPFEYLSAKMRKEDAVSKIAERDGIEEGLVCVFSALEPCRTFSLRFTTGQPYVPTAKRKCLHLYYYFMDRDLGLLHVRVQTWFPLKVQIYLNGHEWLERKLTAGGIEHAKIDNVFIRVGDLPRAQRLADRFAHLNWPRILNRYARQVVPQLGDMPSGCEYYWVGSPGRILHRRDVQVRRGSARSVPAVAQPQHVVLRRCRGHELPRSQAGTELPGRGGLRSVKPRVPPHRRLVDQAPCQAEPAEDVRQGGPRVEDRDRAQQSGRVPRAQAGLAQWKAAR